MVISIHKDDKIYDIGIMKNQFVILNEEGVGGEFDPDDVSNMLFDAVDKFFKEHLEIT